MDKCTGQLTNIIMSHADYIPRFVEVFHGTYNICRHYNTLQQKAVAVLLQNMTYACSSTTIHCKNTHCMYIHHTAYWVQIRLLMSTAYPHLMHVNCTLYYPQLNKLGKYSFKPGSHLFCLRCVAAGSAYKMIWTRVATQDRNRKVLFLRSYTHPNHFICTSGRNAMQAKRCEPGFTLVTQVSIISTLLWTTCNSLV